MESKRDKGRARPVVEAKKAVSSIIEITKSKVETSRVNQRSLSLIDYHRDIEGMSKKIEKFAIGLSNENLLSVKMALMGAVRLVEVKLKERREK